MAANIPMPAVESPQQSGEAAPGLGTNPPPTAAVIAAAEGVNSEILEPPVENLVPIEWRGDARVEWLREKVTTALDVTRPVFDTVFKEHGGEKSLFSFLDKRSSCIVFWSDTRTVKVVTKVPIFVEYTPEEIAKRKQAAAAAAVAAAEAGANAGTSQVESPIASQEEEKGYWETQDVVSMTQNQVVCSTTGKLPNEVLNRPVVYFINIFPQQGKLDFEKMHRFLEFGVLPSGPTLSTLEQLLFHLFMPILAREGIYGGSKFWRTEETHMMEYVGNELLSNMQRFLSQVSIAQQHLLGDAQLVIPSLPADCLDKTDIDYELILQLESLLADWIPAIIHAVEVESVKVSVNLNVNMRFLTI
ncbi:hypothetical protein R1flu_026895 [Riccia fluitans]|uniref:Uncharacterized protein n=1 Tax=Riccia fluitans TaxID=41844 RepID=A0ABD1XH87_9MARC